MAELTEEQQRFCREYAANPNGTTAYIKSFPESSYQTAKRESSRLRQTPTIAEEINAIRNAYAKRSKTSAIRVLKELVGIAHFDPGDVFEDVGDNPAPKPWRKVNPSARRAISKIKIKRKRLSAGPKNTDDKTCWEVEEIEYSFCSKLDALDKLCKHLGITKDGAALEQLLTVLSDPAEGTEATIPPVLPGSGETATACKAGDPLNEKQPPAEPGQHAEPTP